MPCSFGLLPYPRSGSWRPAQRSSSSDRECPLDTAGDRCLWHVGGTAGENDGARTWPLRLQLDCSVRPVLGDHRLVGKSPEGSRQPGGETRTPTRLLKLPPAGDPAAAAQCPGRQQPRGRDGAQHMNQAAKDRPIPSPWAAAVGMGWVGLAAAAQLRPRGHQGPAARPSGAGMGLDVVSLLWGWSGRIRVHDHPC
jgi:hypothetical protein